MPRPDTETRPLQIQPGATDRALTPEQERFNALVRDVASWRAAVAQWKDAIERYDQAVEPVRRELLAAWRDWVFALDTASLLPGLARSERVQLGELLRETATALLDSGREDADIAAVLHRHSDDAKDDAQPSSASLLSDATQATGEEEDLEHLAQMWEQQAEAAAAHREQRAASRRAEKLAARRKHETQEVSQSLRDVYRKVASALHPDRETDAQERARKTVLMQHANQAYEAGNLLALLELQLDAEQVDMARLASLDERRLQHYVMVLQGQLAELQAEARRLEAEFRAAAGMPAGAGLPPRKVDRFISAEARRMREDLVLLRRQTRMLADVDAVRSWLKEERRADRQ